MAVHVGHDDRTPLRPDARGRVVIQPHSLRLFLCKFGAGVDQRHPPVAGHNHQMSRFLFQQPARPFETIVSTPSRPSPVTLVFSAVREWSLEQNVDVFSRAPSWKIAAKIWKTD